MENSPRNIRGYADDFYSVVCLFRSVGADSAEDRVLRGSARERGSGGRAEQDGRGV